MLRITHTIISQSIADSSCITLYILHTENMWGPVVQWLRYCATNRKVTSLIPDGVMEFFIDIILLIALGLTQPVTEMNTRGISRGICGWCVRLITLPPSCTVVMKSGNLNFLQPSGPLQACNRTALPLPFLL